MRTITGAIISSNPCALPLAAAILARFSDTAASHLPTSDCATYVRVAADAATNHLRYRHRLAANLDTHVFEGLPDGERENQGGEKDGLAEVLPGGPLGSIEEAELAVAADEKKSKKRKKEEEPQEDKAVAGVDSHIPASPEILSEQRKKKEKHSNKEFLSVVKQEPDLVVEADEGSERKKKKKKKHSDKEVDSIVKQEPRLVVEEELGSEKKKGKKQKEKGIVKPEDGVVEGNGRIVNNGVAEQGVADGEEERKKKKHSKEEGDPKGVTQEEKMTIDSDLNSEKKKEKKRGRGQDDDNVQEQGEHKKKKQGKES